MKIEEVSRKYTDFMPSQHQCNITPRRSIKARYSTTNLGVFSNYINFDTKCNLY